MRKLIYPLLLCFAACIQTEMIPEVLEPELTLGQTALSITLGQTNILTAIFTDEQRIDQSALITWSSTAPQTATVTPQGAVSGVSVGQAWAVASTPGNLRDSVLITVVANANAVASVEIVNPPANVSVGSTAIMQARVLNTAGQVLSGKTVQWISNNESIVSISQNGTATAMLEGTAQITASSEGVNSLPTTIMVQPLSGATVSGNFSGNGGYSVKGTATLRQTNNIMTLVLEDNFMSSSGPQLGVYLAKNASGSLNSQNSLFLGNLQKNTGMQTYAVPAGVALNDYGYAVIYCIPFTVRFGTATFN